jgi:hypothetical protein
MAGFGVVVAFLELVVVFLGLYLTIRLAVGHAIRDADGRRARTRAEEWPSDESG